MVRGKNRIPYWIDRRLTGLAEPEYDATISFGLPIEPEDSQYGKYRVYTPTAWSQELTEQIYHLNTQGQLDPMAEEPFDLEDTLQKLVADHPKLLSGEQINPNDPRRWILIRREQGIADTEDGSYRWALDHLLIDQDAIPTLVETKRSDNSEIRRTVVGQMLDYAAFARRTWKVQDIRRDFEESENIAGRNPDDTLTKLLRLDGEPDADEFWQRVETNLRAARLRLLFVADDIPDELTRVVEFLNEQMPGIEVLAVEIKQFLGATGKTLVPRVIGRTTANPDKPSKGSRTKLSHDEFLAQMPSPQVRQAAEQLMNVAKERGGFVYFGSKGISIRCHCPAWPRALSLVWIYPFPGRTGWSVAKEFTFGMTLWDMGKQPAELLEILKGWSAQFEGDTFVTRASSSDIDAWSITHKDAVGNIDLLAERLATVLTSLQRLGPAHE